MILLKESVEQPFVMFEAHRDIYAETAMYRQFSGEIHHHDYYQCMVITQGICLHKVDDQEVVLQKHDAFILPPGISHIMYHPSENLEFYHLAVREPFFKKFLELPSMLNTRYMFETSGEGNTLKQLQQIVSLEPTDFHMVLSLLDCLILELSRMQDLSSAVVENVTETILLIFTRVLMRQDYLKADAKNAQEKRINDISKCIRYIDLNYAKPISIELLAKQTALSRSAFYDSFCKLVGQSPHNYIVSKRIAAAQLLLIDTRMSISEVSCCVGFRDLATFHRNFSEICGCSPGQFRERAKKDACHMI